MNKSDIINKLIPADDLHWIDGEGFTLLSSGEITNIIQTCYKHDMPEDDIFKTVQWCESTRANEILWKNVMSGGIRIHSFEDNNPVFVKNENNNA